MRDKFGSKGPRRDVAKERFWRRMLKRLDRARLTVRTFCRKHDISEHPFYSWRREIKRRDQNEPRGVKPKVQHDATIRYALNQ